MTLSNAAKPDPVLQLARFAWEMSDLIESTPLGSPANDLARRLEKSARRAIVELSRDPAPPLALSAREQAAADKLVATLANRCESCGCSLVRTPGAASRTHDGPRLCLVECSNPACDYAEAIGDES